MPRGVILTKTSISRTLLWITLYFSRKIYRDFKAFSGHKDLFDMEGAKDPLLGPRLNIEIRMHPTRLSELCLASNESIPGRSQSLVLHFHNRGISLSSMNNLEGFLARY